MNNPHTYDMNQRIKYSRSEKVYLPGQIYPDLRVAMRRVEQVPSTTFDENGDADKDLAFIKTIKDGKVQFLTTTTVE